ncbi:hypothetical protein L3Q82_019178 [Scortum barcoo]|uniref:Uncharacterized protein n=1 Tax=Scortum barcoo TaxID=214431 RepID=A0ACB8VG78_9TELE|nr:hypothetical protein L3Q82_019178 [Scortum barcoo]
MGLSSSVALTSSSPTAPGPATSSLTPSQDSSAWREKVQEEENILPTSRVIAAITWDIENAVLRAQQQQPDQTRAGTSGPLVCHPWRCPVTSSAMGSLVQALMSPRHQPPAPSAARGKSSHQPPSGLLQPLSVPGRPWSHIALDFVTGLPPSNGKTVILTIVDRFSKAAHFVALPQAPHSP